MAMLGPDNSEPEDIIQSLTTDQLRRMLKTCRNETEILKQALLYLVRLKDMKDSQGKTDLYKRHQPQAWEEARKVLRRYGYEV